jgi:hypothetical protein
MAGTASSIATVIGRLMAAFPDARRDGKLTAGIYLDGLRGIRPDIVERAASKAIEASRYFPTVAELRERCETEALHVAIESAQPARDTGAPFTSWNRHGEGLQRIGEDDEAMLWRMRVRAFHKRAGQGLGARQRPYWPDMWGPAPDRPGCRCPGYILREFGFTPIAEAGASERTAESIAKVRVALRRLDDLDRSDPRSL